MFSFTKNFDSYPDGLEVWQVAIILNVGQNTVRRLIRDRKIPAFKIGRAYLIDKHSLRVFIESRSTKINASEVGDDSGV